MFALNFDFGGNIRLFRDCVWFPGVTRITNLSWVYSVRNVTGMGGSKVIPLVSDPHV